MTMAGRGKAKAATRSHVPASTTRSTSSSTSDWTWARRPSIALGVNAHRTGSRSRVWSGSSRKTIQPRRSSRVGAMAVRPAGSRCRAMAPTRSEERRSSRYPPTTWAKLVSSQARCRPDQNTGPCSSRRAARKP